MSVHTPYDRGSSHDLPSASTLQATSNGACDDPSTVVARLEPLDATVSILINGTPRTVSAGTTVALLLVEFGLPARSVAVEINKLLAPRAVHATRYLADGDQVEIVSLVGGG